MIRAAAAVLPLFAASSAFAHAGPALHVHGGVEAVVALGVIAVGAALVWRARSAAKRRDAVRVKRSR